MKHLLAFLAACTPVQEPLGDPLWSIQVTDAGPSLRLGPAGHLVHGNSFLVLTTPDGFVAWEQSCRGQCGAPAIDRDGNVYRLTRTMTQQTLTKHAADSGDVLWTRILDVTQVIDSFVAIDANQHVWWFVRAKVPVDLGGGEIVTTLGHHPFVRYTPEGSYETSGTIDAVATPMIVPLSTGGFMTLSLDRTVTTFDDMGRVTTRIERPPRHPVHGFVLHETGELTLLERDLSDDAERGSIVRLDADHHERWQRRCNGCEQITPITGGIVVVAGGDSLTSSGSSDAPFLARFGPDGDMRRELVDEDFALYIGPVLDSYRVRITETTRISTIVASQLRE